jgi:hypothetical protein
MGPNSMPSIYPANKKFISQNDLKVKPEEV